MQARTIRRQATAFRALARAHRVDEAQAAMGAAIYTDLLNGDGLSDDIDPTDHAMVEAKALAKKIYFGRIVDVSEGATHYHNTTVNPYWASQLTKVLSVGTHLFYRY